MTPRQKAVAGIRRRREAKKPIRKKLIAMGRRLHQVLLASAFVVGSMANECILEPGINLLTGNGELAEDGGGAAFLEVFAGSAKLSGAFAAAWRGYSGRWPCFLEMIYGKNQCNMSSMKPLTTRSRTLCGWLLLALNGVDFPG
jgi:hypothetical protein